MNDYNGSCCSGLYFFFVYVSMGCGIFDIIIARRWESAYSGVQVGGVHRIFLLDSTHEWR